MSKTSTTQIESAPATAEASRGVPKWVWIAQLTVAVILGMTLPFKFSGAPETVKLFDTLGVGAAGRIGSGVMEAVAVVMMLVPGLAAVGGVLTLGIMGGAILSHVFVLGIVWEGDASLFSMAVAAFVAGGIVAWVRRRELPVIGQRME